MITTALLLVFGLVFVHITVPLFCRYILGWRISNQEILIQIGIGAFSVILMTGITMMIDTADTEIHNGRVNAKERVRVSCSHSYDCFCTTYTNSNGTTSRSCQTCYRHSNDYDWMVRTTVGDFNIERLDSQGVKEPPRWTKAKVGEPASAKKRYINYVKAAPDSLFSARNTYEGRWNKVPYPNIHDYYRINRVINMAGYNIGSMNDDLNEWLKNAGYNKEVNAIVILTEESSKDYGEFIRQTWLGGKKNDVVVVLNPGDGNIKWIRVFSWSKNTAVHSFIEDTTSMDDLTDNIIQGVNRYYVRRPMEEFEYLKDDIRPPMFLVLLVMLFNVGLSVALSIYMHRNYVA